MNKENREEKILGTLEKAGYRITKPRQILVELVNKQTSAFTGEELYHELNKKGIGRATMFRNLRILQDIGILTRLHLYKKCHYYVLSHPAKS